jgi:hypothetical protein
VVRGERAEWLRLCRAAVSNFLRVDDILAALILSLVMMRRIEVKTTRAEHNPGVPPEKFADWRARSLRAYAWVGWSSFAKIIGSVGWYIGAVPLGIGAPWFQIGGMLIFLGWLLSLVWAWRAATDTAHLRRQLGIQLRPRATRRPDDGVPPGSLST